MKVKYNHADGGEIYTFGANDVSLKEAIELLKNRNVISITITKQTPAQYFRSHRALKAKEEADG